MWGRLDKSLIQLNLTRHQGSNPAQKVPGQQGLLGSASITGQRAKEDYKKHCEQSTQHNKLTCSMRVTKSLASGVIMAQERAGVKLHTPDLTFSMISSIPGA